MYLIALLIEYKGIYFLLNKRSKNYLFRATSNYLTETIDFKIIIFSNDLFSNKVLFYIETKYNFVAL